MQLQGFAAVIDALSLVLVTSFILCEVLDVDGSDFPASPDVAGHWISPPHAEAVHDLRRLLPGRTLPDFVAAAPVLRPPAGETVEEPVHFSGIRVPTSFHRPSPPPPASSHIPRGRSCRLALAPLLRCAPSPLHQWGPGLLSEGAGLHRLGMSAPGRLTTGTRTANRPCMQRQEVAGAPLAYPTAGRPGERR